MILSTLLLSALFATKPPTALPVLPPSPLETIARDMLSNFNAEQFEAASKDFTDTMRKTATPQVLAEQKKQMDAQIGKFATITAVHQSRSDGFRVVDLTAKYEKSSVAVRVVFDIFNHIGATYFDPIKPTPPDPVLEAKARELVENFVAGRNDAVAKDFAPKLRTQLPAWRIAELNKDVARLYGSYRSIIGMEKLTENGLTVLQFTLDYTMQPARIRVVFNNFRQVAGMHVSPIPPRD
jgi:hypothetical protein